MKSWLIPLFAVLLYGCDSGPDEQTISQQVSAQLLAAVDENTFEIKEFEVIDSSQYSDQVYRVKVAYQLVFKQSYEQLEALAKDDLTYNKSGPFQQQLSLMELERRYGQFEPGQQVAQEADVWMMNTEQGWQLAEPVQ